MSELTSNFKILNLWPFIELSASNLGKSVYNFFAGNFKMKKLGFKNIIIKEAVTEKS